MLQPQMSLVALTSAQTMACKHAQQASSRMPTPAGPPQQALSWPACSEQAVTCYNTCISLSMSNAPVKYKETGGLFRYYQVSWARPPAGPQQQGAGPGCAAGQQAQARLSWPALSVSFGCSRWAHPVTPGICACHMAVALSPVQGTQMGSHKTT
jgi:hypothetical protein